MRKNNSLLYTLILSGFILINSACAQNPPAGKAYVDEEHLAEQSTVLLNNGSYLIPLQNLEQLRIASVHFSNTYAAGFDSLLNKYEKITVFDGNSYIAPKSLDDLSNDLRMFNTIIIQLNESDLSNPQLAGFVAYNQRIKNVVIALFGSSNAMLKLNTFTVPVIWSTRISPVSAFYSAQAIFGGVPITQKLRKDVSATYRKNMGFTTEKIRLQYTVPEDAGVNASNLLGIDSVANEAIMNQATPGCVVLVAKDSAARQVHPDDFATDLDRKCPLTGD